MLLGVSDFRARTLSSRGVPRSRRAPAWVLAVLAVLVAAGTSGPASFAAEDDDLRAELLAGADYGEWRGTLESRILSRDSVGGVLGPLFDDRDRVYADRLPCVAFTAAYLADHPVGGRKEVLLADAILRRAHRDPDFVAGMRMHLLAVQGVRPGWDLLLEHARKASLGPDSSGDDATQRAALWFLGREPTTSALWFLHERGKALAGNGNGNGNPTVHEPGGLATEWLEALKGVLSYRFPTVAEAMQFLDGVKGATREEVLAALLRRGSPDAEQHRATAIAWGKRLVGLAARPEDLMEFVDATRTVYVEVRREAIQRALQLLSGQGVNAADAAAWRELLCLALDGGEDDEVLRGAITFLERASFRETPVVARDLAGCVSARLRKPAPAVTTADRARLATILGSLEDAGAVLEALSWARSASAETEVLTALIRATGQVRGISPDVAVQYFVAHPGDTERDREVRLAVADALGRPGQTGIEGAGAALRGILTGEGVAGVARETTPAIRALAIQRLQSHPGPQTSGVLRALAEGADAAEAKDALGVLGRQGREPSAAVALAEIARGGGPEERRLAAVRELAKIAPELSADVRARVAEPVRLVLVATELSDGLRREALTTAAQLGDPGPLDAATAYVLERPEDVERRPPLQALLEAVASAGEANDLAIDQALGMLSAHGEHDFAVALAAALAEAHRRPHLLVTRARALFARANVEARDEADRQRDLEEAAALLETATVAPREARMLQFHVLVLEELGSHLPAGAQRNEMLLRAVEKATLVADRGLAEEGERVARALDQHAKTTPLSERDRARFAEFRAKLERVLRPPG